MATIKTISKCFKEVKKLTGDLLPDEQINQILDEAKIKINETKFNQQQSKTDKLLAEEIINQFEYEQALNKRNKAENNIKALDRYQNIIDAIELSGGKIDAEKGALALLVGIQEFSNITRNSIGAKLNTIEVIEVQRLYQAINKLGDNVWEDFTSGVFDLEIKQAMLGETVLNENAQ